MSQAAQPFLSDSRCMFTHYKKHSRSISNMEQGNSSLKFLRTSGCKIPKVPIIMDWGCAAGAFDEPPSSPSAGDSGSVVTTMSAHCPGRNVGFSP